VSEHRVKLALKKLEMKGFIKCVRRSKAGFAYLLNPLLLEAAYDRTKRDYPDLLAS
jgi:hypothetical protein